MSKIDRLGARIRGEYERIAENVGKCVFCDLRDKYVVTRENNWVLTTNLYPYINGQLLVLPERHIEDYQELGQEDALASDRLIKTGINLLKNNLQIENFWIILRTGEKAGKTVRHLHWNIMPYTDALNTWHHQEISIEPLDLASRLRESLKNERT